MKKKVIVYGLNTSPKTNILKYKLTEGGYEIELIDSADKIAEKGITTIPIVEYEGRLLTYIEAVGILLGK